MSLKLYSETHKTIAGTNDCPEAVSVFAADVNGSKPADPGQLRQSFRVRTIRFV